MPPNLISEFARRSINNGSVTRTTLLIFSGFLALFLEEKITPPTIGLLSGLVVSLSVYVIRVSVMSTVSTDLFSRSDRNSL